VKKLGGPEYYRKRTKQLRRKTKRKWYSGFFQEKGRHYEQYNKLFSVGLGCSIVDALVGLGRKKLTIVDDGAGKGHFLAELKPMLKEKGIESETIALSVSRRLTLWMKKKKGLIDEVFLKDAAEFVPKKPVDAIFSFFGSISYIEDLVRKEHVLKFAHSLRKGGIMAVGLNVVRVMGESRAGDIHRGLSRDPIDRIMSLETEMKGIERAFEKRGFEASFVPSGLPSRKAYPNWMLILKRVK
jgi:hypothetical protein